MNDPANLHPAIVHAQSFSNAARLAGCVGSLYIATLLTIFAPDYRLAVFCVSFIVATGFSLLTLYLLSLFIAPFISDHLYRIRKGRLLLFTIIGGILSMVLSILLLIAWFVFKGKVYIPTRTEAIIWTAIITTLFVYGSSWGAFTSLIMKSKDRPQINPPP